MNTKSLSDPQVQKFTALLSATEVGLGSLLHAFHLPFAGHFLSLNQGAMNLLLLKNEKIRRKAVAKVNAVSVASSLMKSLSPAGKKLTPMLAISVQGLLFSLGVLLFGVNLLGVWLGMLLLSVWGFIQPLLVAYALFGSHIFDAIMKMWTEFSVFLSIPEGYGVGMLTFVVLVKCALASIVTVLFWSQEKYEERYLAWMEELRTKKPLTHRSKKWRFHPWLVLSFVVSIAYFAMSGEINANTVWAFILRPIAVSIVFLALAPKIHKAIRALSVTPPQY